MAKIRTVHIQSLPNFINVGKQIDDITIHTEIEFHPLDVQLSMPYCLHLFVYDIHGESDVPIIVPNWDESTVLGVSLDRKDDYLGQKTVLVTAANEECILDTPMALKLGDFNREKSYTSRKIEVFATLAPVVGRVSKWSEPVFSRIVY